MWCNDERTQTHNDTNTQRHNAILRAYVFVGVAFADHRSIADTLVCRRRRRVDGRPGVDRHELQTSYNDLLGGDDGLLVEGELDDETDGVDGGV